MPRWVKLTEKEIGQIMAYNDLKVSHREIARRIKRSQTFMRTILADPENYGIKKSPRRRSEISNREKRFIII